MMALCHNHLDTERLPPTHPPPTLHPPATCLRFRSPLLKLRWASPKALGLRLQTATLVGAPQTAAHRRWAGASGSYRHRTLSFTTTTCTTAEAMLWISMLTPQSLRLTIISVKTTVKKAFSWKRQQAVTSFLIILAAGTVSGSASKQTLWYADPSNTSLYCMRARSFLCPFFFGNTGTFLLYFNVHDFAPFAIFKGSRYKQHDH